MSYIHQIPDFDQMASIKNIHASEQIPSIKQKRTKFHANDQNMTVKMQKRIKWTSYISQGIPPTP